MSADNDSPTSNAPTDAGAPRSHRTRTLLLIFLFGISSAALIYFIKHGKAAWPAPSGKNERAEEKSDYYCPMHPSYHSDKPGNCPVCAMKLVKLEKPTGNEPKAPAQPMAGMSMGAPEQGAVYIAPQKQQLIGMRSVAAAVRPLAKEIRSVGKVAYDETRVTHIHTKVSGYIEEVYANYIGKPVRRGEPLFTIYSPDLVSTQQEYLLALKSRTVLSKSSFPEIARGSDNLVAAARERLRLWDITEDEIKRLEQEGTVKRAIAVYSPVSGIVTARAAYHHGTFVDPEMELFTIIDLSEVWVLGEIYEYELPFVRVGQLAEVSFPYAVPAKTLHGKVSFISPFVDPKTRTSQVRIEFSNPGLELKPDSFANVVLHANLGSLLVVPQDAVLNTGTEQYVFLDLGQGYVEPRRVQVGPASGESVAILKGLKPGDRVVTAANFILDAESRLKGAFANMGSATPVPVAQAGPVQQLSISILEPKQAKVGPNPVRVSVKDFSGKPVEGADVEITLFMPQMGTMAPMTAKANLKPVGGGEYAGTVDVPMAWTWQTTVTVRKGTQVLGSMQTTLTAR
jgi:membrane fusion protein, copper/silver efflux system